MPLELLDDLDQFLDAQIIETAGTPHGELVAALALDLAAARHERPDGTPVSN
jgi:hypothetical protein